MKLNNKWSFKINFQIRKFKKKYSVLLLLVTDNNLKFLSFLTWIIFNTKAYKLIEATQKAIFQFFNFHRTKIQAFKKLNKVVELTVQIKIH